MTFDLHDFRISTDLLQRIHNILQTTKQTPLSMPCSSADISWVLCIELGDGTLFKVSAERLVTENEAEWELTFISAVSDPDNVITDYFCPKLLNTVFITI